MRFPHPSLVDQPQMVLRVAPPHLKLLRLLRCPGGGIMSPYPSHAVALQPFIHRDFQESRHSARKTEHKVTSAYLWFPLPIGEASLKHCSLNPSHHMFMSVVSSTARSWISDLNKDLIDFESENLMSNLH